MANILPLNTSYSSPKLKIPVTPIPSLSKTVLSDKAKAAKPILPNLQSAVSPSAAINTSYNPHNLNESTPFLGNEGVSLNTPFAPGSDTTQQIPFPSGYQFSQKTGTNIPYPVPETARLTQLSKSLGGGVIAQDIKDKNKVYLSYRAETGSEKGIDRGGLSGNLYEVDHIVPEDMGGADIDANKQTLYWTDHLKKSQVQAVADALRSDWSKPGEDKNKKISFTDALHLSLNWYDKNTDNIDLVAKDAKGNIQVDAQGKPVFKPLSQNEAWNIYQEWQKPKELTASDYWDAFKNISSDNKYENWVLESAHHLVNSLSFGLIKTGQIDYSKSGGENVGKAIGFASDVAGFMAGFGLVKGGIGAGLALAGEALGPAAAAVEAAKAGETVAQVGKATKIAGKTSQIFTKASSLFKPQLAPMTGFYKLAEDKGFQYATQKSAASVLKAATGDVIVNNLIGQLSESTTPPDERNRLERVFFDSANGVMMNVMPEGVKGSLGVAGTTALLTRWEGAPWSEALRNGVVFGGMHGMASLQGGGKIFEKNNEQNVRNVAWGKRNDLLSRAGETAYTADQFSKMTPETKTARLEFEDNLATDVAAKMVESGEPLVGKGMTGSKSNTDEASTAYLNKWFNDTRREDIILGGKLLSGDIEIVKAPMWEKKPVGETIWNALNGENKYPIVPLEMQEHIPPEMMKYIGPNADQFNLGERPTPLPTSEQNSFLQTRLSEVKDPDMKFQITGQAVSGSPQSTAVNKNLNSAIDQAQKTGSNPRFWFVDSPEYSFIQSKRTDVVDPYPTKNIAVVAEVQGGMVIVGHVAMPDRIGKYDMSDPEHPVRISGRANSQNDTSVKNGRSPDLISEHNKNTLSDFMDSNKTKVMEARVLALDHNKNDGTPYVILNTDPAMIQEAIIRNFDVPQEKTYVSSQQLRESASLSKQRPGGQAATVANVESKKTIQTPIDVLKGTDVVNIPVTDSTPPAVKADISMKAGRAQNNLTSFLEEAQGVIKTGDAKMVKSYFDETVGKNVITIDDAKNMISDSHELSTADLLPIGDGKFDSILSGAQKTGTINENGLSLLSDLDYVMENHPDFVKALGESTDKGLMNNYPIDTSIPLKTSLQPTKADIRTNNKTTMAPEVRHTDLASKMAEAGKTGPTVTIAPKVAETSVQTVKTTPDAKSTAEVINRKDTFVPVIPERNPLFNENENKRAIPVIPENKFMPGESVEIKNPAANDQTVQNTPSVTDTFQEKSDKTSARDFRQFSEQGVVKGLADNIDSQLAKTETSPEQTKKADALKESVSVKNIYVKSKELVTEHGGNENKAFDEFVGAIESKYKDLGIESPLKDRKNSAALKSLFKRSAQSVPDRALLIGSDKTTMINRNPKPASHIDEVLGQLNKEKGTNIDSIQVQLDPKIESKDINLENIRNKMYDNGYVPFGNTGNSEDTLFGIKYDPTIGGSENIRSGAPKFFDYIVHEVLGIDRNADKTMLNKRWKELNFSEFKPTNDSNVKKRLIVIDFGKDANGHEIVDGGGFTHTKDMQGIAKDGGYLQNPKQYLDNKSVITFPGEDGNLVIVKHELFGVKPSSATARALEEHVRRYIPDYTLQEGDVIESHNNIKAGSHILSNFGNGENNYYIGEFPMSAFRAKYELPKSNTTDYKFSPYLNSKFGFDDGLNPIVEQMNEAPMKRFNEAFDKLVHQSTTAREAQAILTEYKDIFKNALGDEAYGKTKKILENGGWGKNGSDIHYELEQTMHDAYKDYILNGKYLKTSYGKFSPDLRILKDSNGKRIEVPEDSIVLPLKTVEKLGSPERVMVTRHPNTKRTGLLTLKVIIAEDHGITDLGKSMIVNNKVGYRELYFDTDGDAGPIYAVGKSEGSDFKIPDTYADKVREIYLKEGGQVPQTLTNYKKGPISLENSLELGAKAVKGGQSVGENSTFRRVIQGILDNNENIGGWTIKKPEPGETAAQRNSRLYKYTEYMSNASTDSVKKLDLDKELKDNKVENLSDLLRTKFFDAPVGVKPQTAIKDFSKDFFDRQTLFQYADDNNKFGSGGMNKMKEDLMAYSENIGSKRSRPGPIDILAKTANDLPVFPKGLSGKEQQGIHDARAANVRKSFTENGLKSATLSDPPVKDYVSYFVKAKDAGFKEISAVRDGPTAKATIKEIKNRVRENVTDYYYGVSPTMSAEEKRAISVWLLVSKKGNMANWGSEQEGAGNSFQNRLAYIINDTPEVAKPYYAISGADTVQK